MEKGISMSIRPINSITNFKTSKTAATNPQQIQNNADESGKSNKKAIVGGLAALAFAGTIAAVAIKRHKVPDEVQSALNNFKTTNEAVNTLAEDVQKQTDEAIECAQKLFDEVTKLFKKGDEIAPDGTVLRKITGDDTRKIMEEFSQDGVLTRNSLLVNGVPRSIVEGIEEFADGSKKIAREVNFYENGKPGWYREGYEFHSDGLWKFAKEIDFHKNGKPAWYAESVEKLADGSQKIAKHYELTDKGWQEVSQ